MFKTTGLFLALCFAFTALLLTACEEAVTYPSYLLPLEEAHFQQGVLPEPSYDGTKDNFLSSTRPDNNFGSETFISIGFIEAQNQEDRSIIEFDLKELQFPVGGVVRSAYLYLNMSVKTRDSDTLHRFAAYEITQPWYEGTGTSNSPLSSGATWNNGKTGVPWTTPGGEYLASSQSSIYKTPIEDQWISIKLNTAMVQRWIEDSVTNNGVVIKKITEDTATDITYFYSSESPETELRPKLSIYYTLR